MLIEPTEMTILVGSIVRIASKDGGDDHVGRVTRVGMDGIAWVNFDAEWVKGLPVDDLAFDHAAGEWRPR